MMEAHHKWLFHIQLESFSIWKNKKKLLLNNSQVYTFLKLKCFLVVIFSPNFILHISYYAATHRGVLYTLIRQIP